MSKSTASVGRRKGHLTSGEWKRPYPDFRLSYHPPSGRLYKSIKGRRVYFGYARDWQAAIDKYLAEKDDLYAGRTPWYPPPHCWSFVHEFSAFRRATGPYSVDPP